MRWYMRGVKLARGGGVTIPRRLYRLAIRPSLKLRPLHCWIAPENVINKTVNVVNMTVNFVNETVNVVNKTVNVVNRTLNVVK